MQDLEIIPVLVINGNKLSKFRALIIEVTRKDLKTFEFLKC